MNYELFIARRIVHSGRGSFSGPVVKIAIASVAIGLAVMIIAVAIVTGFQKQIQEKITGFAAHIQIARFDENSSYELSPVNRNQKFLTELKSVKGIRHIQVFGTKAGIIKAAEQMQGVVFHGVGSDFDWKFFNDKMVDGSTFRVSDTSANDSVIISRSISKLLKLNTGDALRMYFFINNQARGRKFVISGIYETGLEEFDRMYVFGDIAHIQKLNGWDSSQVSGFEVYITDYRDIEKMGKTVYDAVGYDLNARTIRDLYPQLFDWLSLQDMNVVIILVLMILVAGITMISTLLILILERTGMIGMLKALGSANTSIRKVFLYNSAYIIAKGLLWGNVTGLLLCFIQLRFHVISLPVESYFMSFVPINLNFLHIILLNAGTIICCIAMLLIPSYIITKISPVKAIRME
ncbi:MAG TPA: ABC transporter permease [Bacteroidales bacterium]|nr:ABC transporter permease [Bacteroidales bacterium]